MREVAIGPEYAHAQLARALRTLEEHPDPEVKARARERVRRWEQILAGLASGAVAVGSRTPVAGAPAWVTLEVAHGGFATGELSAGGPLQAHETELLARLGLSGQGRAALNLYYISEAGQAALAAMLASGRYRIEVPEEGALLVVTWLLGQGHVEAAHALLDVIFPWFPRLRFYPRPDPAPLLTGAVVKLEPAAATRKRLEAIAVPPRIAAMNEALQVWGPQTDKIVALFLETVSGDRPAMRREGERLVVVGGRPCAVYPEGWYARAQAWLEEYRELRRRYPASPKPDNPRENLARLRGFLERIVGGEAPTPAEIGMIRKIVAAHVHRHGAPGSPELAARRAAQAEMAARPTHRAIARVVGQRLSAVPEGAGIGAIEEATAPVRAEEATAEVPAGTVIPASLQARLVRCLEAPVEELVTRGAIRSSETLARVLPELTAQVTAAAFASAELRTLYGAIYAAFRRRRSLLLLHLERQVRFEELPWVAALSPYREAGLDARTQAARTLQQVTTLAITAFPQTILPNKLITELRALARAAAIEVPLVNELAADIFMGALSEHFLRAAQVAGRQLQGSVYERYYGVPCARVLAMTPREKEAPELVALCEELAGTATGPFSAARNGMVLEQVQIVTTHNLAALFEALGLDAQLRARLPELAERCFRWVCRWQRARPRAWRAALQRVKNSAYAFRQMIYFLARAEPAALPGFLAWAERHVAAQPPAFRRRFGPVLRGLAWVASGGSFDSSGLLRGSAAQGRRLLGWTRGRHWLLDEPDASDMSEESLM